MRKFFALLMILIPLGVSAELSEIAVRRFNGELLSIVEDDDMYAVLYLDTDRNEMVMDWFFHLTINGDKMKTDEAKAHAMEWYFEYTAPNTDSYEYSQPKYIDSNGRIYKTWFRHHSVYMGGYAYFGIFKLEDDRTVLVTADKFRGSYSLAFSMVEGDSFRLVTDDEEEIHEAVSRFISCRYAPSKEQFLSDMFECGKDVFERFSWARRETCELDDGTEYVIHWSPSVFMNNIYK